MKPFEELIGYTFKNKTLMQNALTHSSYANERHVPYGSNERLEFLGDAVLSIVVSRHLYQYYKDLPEGELTKIRAALVCEKALYTFADQMGLGQYLYLSRGEENTGGRKRPSLLADAFEAVIAAIYLDGGSKEVDEYIMQFVAPAISGHTVIKVVDYKTRLQEVIQHNRDDRLSYALVGEKGPDHDKLFIVDVLINSNIVGTGEGKSKKEAEQMAAKEALSMMGII